MKKTLLLFAFSSFSFFCFAQPAIEWQHTYGGSSAEVANSVIQTVDGGYVVAGYSDSNDGDITTHHGTTVYSDFWVMKMDAAGAMVWQKSFGGSVDDIAYSVVQTKDGGYAVAGYSQSNDGDLTFHSGTASTSDYWIIKLDGAGNLEWQKSFGGTKNDKAFSIIQTEDKGYAVAGYTFSNDGDVVGQHVSGPNQVDDYWIVKLDSTGTLEWQKCLGGVLNDEAHSIIQNTDGTYTVAGFTSSNQSGDVLSFNHGGSDFWVVKISSTGTLIWQKLFGGTGYDFAWTVLPASDGGYAVGGYSASNNGDATGNHGNDDYWITKIDSMGVLQWQHSYGGTAFENTAALISTSDGGYAFGGYTTSNNGDVSGNHGASDFWVIKTDSVGTLQWQRAMGGTTNEAAYSIVQSADGGYVIAGDATSTNGDVTANQGSFDYWVVKLYPCLASVTSLSPSSCLSYSLNGVTYTNSGTYTQTLSNFHGCDSIITINLTINTADSTTVTASGYCSYTLNSQTYTTSGTYTQQLTNAHSCDSIITLHLTINTIDPNATQAGVTLTAVEAGALYQWVDCTNGYSPIAGEMSQSFTATANGNYAVIVSNGNCVDTSACMPVFTVSVNEWTMDNGEWTISPNPTTGEFQISDFRFQISDWKVVDILGNIMQQQTANGSTGSAGSLTAGSPTRQLTIDLSGFAKGIYFVEVVTTDLQVMRKKVVLE